MERLVKKNVDGSLIENVANIPLSRLRRICKRLADYEDTGLTPEEIHNLNNFKKSQVAILLKQNAELRQKCDYWHREAKKWCNELGEGRIGPLLYMDERGKDDGN